MPHMPQPRREDIPDDATPGDVLFEVRQHSWEWTEWRDSVNGDLAFLKRLRWFVTFVMPRAFAVSGFLVMAAIGAMAVVR
jgi:hypothetical protein